MSTAIDTGWRLRAACADMAVADVDLVFFTHDELAVAVALRTCRRCDVRAECLADDLARAGTAEEITGIRAGLRAIERRRMWRRQNTTTSTTTNRPGRTTAP